MADILASLQASLHALPLFSKTFDSTTALTSLYLWLLLGFLSTMISCDFKKWIDSNIWFRHIIGLVGFFFLFTVIDASNRSSLGITFVKTFFVYGIFLLMVKSKWYFSLPVLALLVIDQSIKVHIEYTKKTQTNQIPNKDMESVPLYESIRNVLNMIIIAIIIIGFIVYAVRQRKTFGADFSWVKLLLYYGCQRT